MTEAVYQTGEIPAVGDVVVFTLAEGRHSADVLAISDKGLKVRLRHGRNRGKEIFVAVPGDVMLWRRD